ncbi:UNVERIFIED_CONTAM: hypothetical protein GTU68_051408, partial [Idotea baltica]|nr:hypothetical protein [Idotea baltica]
ATSRSVLGKGASRRLRRENLVPGILYGAEEDPQPINLKHNEVIKHLENDQFYSNLLMVSVDGKEAVRTVLRDVQRHPYKQQILHLDFQRVVAGAELTLTVALNFLNEEACYGVKTEGGMITHNESEVAIACLPRNIPDNLEIDMTDLKIGDSVHLSDLKLPEGVRLTDLIEGDDDSDRAVASVIASRKTLEEEDEEAAEAAEAAAAAEPAEGDEEKKDDE